MTNNATPDKAHILALLDTFARQRPGLDYGNYGCPASYRAEVRAIGRDLADARTLLRAVEMSGITGEEMAQAFPRAFCGRLEIRPDGKGLEYCTGQYFPTEYRRAVCAVLARALWNHRAADYPPGSGVALRARFRKVYGRGLASRWFS